MSVLHLDLRDRPPPEPMERILQALPILPDGWRLVAGSLVESFQHTPPG